MLLCDEERERLDERSPASKSKLPLPLPRPLRELVAFKAPCSGVGGRPTPAIAAAWRNGLPKMAAASARAAGENGSASLVSEEVPGDDTGEGAAGDGERCSVPVTFVTAPVKSARCPPAAFTASLATASAVT